MKKKAEEYRRKFKIYGLKSCSVLKNNVGNCRYPGFSEFNSSNGLQNSHYMWGLPKDMRFKEKNYRQLCDNIYQLPSINNKRSAGIGYGNRMNLFKSSGKFSPSPAEYKIKTLFECNKDMNKGATISTKYSYGKNDSGRRPGPGAYDLSYKHAHERPSAIPIQFTFRHGFFYDEDLKHKKYTVSMQKYSPNRTLTEASRFDNISFGIGNRPPLSVVQKTPGPGTYNIPRLYDRGIKGKPTLN